MFLPQCRFPHTARNQKLKPNFFLKMFTSFFLDISSTNTYKIIFKKKKGVGPERVVKKMAVCCGHIFILIETSAGTHIFEKALTPHLALLASSVSSV